MWGVCVRCTYVCGVCVDRCMCGACGGVCGMYVDWCVGGGGLCSMCLLLSLSSVKPMSLDSFLRKLPSNVVKDGRLISVRQDIQQTLLVCMYVRT